MIARADRGAMAPRKLVVWAAVLGGSLGLAGCSTGSSPPAAKAPVAGSTSPPTTHATVPPSTTTTALGTQNLVVTAAVRTALVQAGATLKGLPVSDFTGLEPGRTYYAYDAATATYWAGAALQPSPSSLPAEVSGQDDGAYLLFSMPAGGNWTAVNDGLGGLPGSTCPLPVPADVLTLWNWPAGTCNPPAVAG
jgi:hypothetical protein